MLLGYGWGQLCDKRQIVHFLERVSEGFFLKGDGFDRLELRVNSLINGKLGWLIRVGSDGHGAISKSIRADSGCHLLKLIYPDLVSNEIWLDASLTYNISFKFMILPLMKVSRGWLPIKV